MYPYHVNSGRERVKRFQYSLNSSVVGYCIVSYITCTGVCTNTGELWIRRGGVVGVDDGRTAVSSYTEILAVSVLGDHVTDVARRRWVCHPAAGSEQAHLCWN